MSRERFKKSTLVEMWWQECVVAGSQVIYLTPDERLGYFEQGHMKMWPEARFAPERPGWYRDVSSRVLFQSWRSWAVVSAPWYIEQVTKAGFMLMFHRVAKDQVDKRRVVSIQGARAQSVRFLPLDEEKEEAA